MVVGHTRESALPRVGTAEEFQEARYVPLGQKPYCCVPASVLTVMQRHGMAMVPQEEVYCSGAYYPSLLELPVSVE